MNAEKRERVAMASNANSPEEDLGTLSYRASASARPVPAKSDPPKDARLKTEFLTSILICAIVGALIDRAFGTAPYGFLVVTFLGGLVGIWNARYVKRAKT